MSVQERLRHIAMARAKLFEAMTCIRVASSYEYIGETPLGDVLSDLHLVAEKLRVQWKQEAAEAKLPAPH